MSPEEKRIKNRDRMRAKRAADPEGERAKKRAYYQANAEHMRQKTRDWAAANPERKADSDAEYRKREYVKQRKRENEKRRMQIPEVRLAAKANNRSWQMRNKYGLTLEQLDRLLASQGGGCAICSKAIAFGVDRHKSVKAHVDHCHTTGRIRGILCNLCNTAIGKLGDTSEGVYRAFLYLQKAETDNYLDGE